MAVKLIFTMLIGLFQGCQPGAAMPQTQPAATAPQPPQAPPDVAPAPPGDAPKPELSDKVNRLLEQLEKNAKDLNAFTAKVMYEKEDAMLGRKELRTGDLIYRVDPQSKEKSFAIFFDFTIVNGRKRPENKRYVFNGRWLAEIDDKEKQFIKREIVPPGKQLDPLKLGEGPFPLPIGQPKAEVLARFDVTAAELPQQGLLKDLQNVDGLLLVPKPGTQEAKDFIKVELFYDRQLLLPVGIHLVDGNGDQKSIKMTDMRRNPTLTEAELAKLNIQDPDPREWRIDIRPWPGGQ